MKVNTDCNRFMITALTNSNIAESEVRKLHFKYDICSPHSLCGDKC